MGTALILSGLRICQQEGHKVVMVLGDLDDYARFGFVTAVNLGLSCKFAVPEAFFLALELPKGALKGKSGTVRYQPEFHLV